MTFQFRNFCQFFEGFSFGFRKFGLGKSFGFDFGKIGLEKKYRFWFRKKLVPAKSLSFGLGKFGHNKNSARNEVSNLGLGLKP